MITFEESIRLLNSIDVKKADIIELPLMEAYGYFLSEDIVASFNSPAFPTAAMDGYAIKFDDQSLGELKVISINPAGAKSIDELIGGKAIKTFTGSLMPKGSDTLIPIENVEIVDNKIIIKEEVPYGFSVREVGENFKEGEVLIKKGTKIDFEEIAVLASLNYVNVKVYSKVNVAIIATGNELLELGKEQTRDTQIRSSNNYTIEAIAKKFGANPINLGCVSDSIEEITNIYLKALEISDIVVSTGGVSVGDYDFVKDVVEKKLGATVLFKGVVIKPGQHIMIATLDNKIIVALPGFAYSSTVTALVYLIPLIYKYYGRDYKMPVVKTKLMSRFRKKSKKTEFTPANLKIIEGELCVDFIGKRDGTSAIMTNMLGECALAITNPDEGDKEAGDYINTFIYNLDLN